MNLEVVNKVLDLGKRTSEHLEGILTVQNELYEAVKDLNEEEMKELISFSENNEMMKAFTARNLEVFQALGWQTE